MGFLCVVFYKTQSKETFTTTSAWEGYNRLIYVVVETSMKKTPKTMDWRNYFCIKCCVLIVLFSGIDCLPSEINLEYTIKLLPPGYQG